MDYTADELATCLKVLQVVARAPSRIDADVRFKTLVAKIHRLGKKGVRQAHKHERVQADRARAAHTGRVAALGSLALPAPVAAEYQRAKPCYCCKVPFTIVHHFYHALCPSCAEQNWTRRTQRADLTGRVAVVTGGRIKSGYQTVLKLLRDGAQVWLTTRFPHDAHQRLSQEADFADWHQRGQICALDLRDLGSVERFTQKLATELPHVDVLVQNAAQTVKRPLAYYAPLLAHEALVPHASGPTLLEARPGYRGHLPVLAGEIAPAARDAEGHARDERATHSWRATLGEVGTIELIETLLVGAIAPFVLLNQLLPLLRKSSHGRRFVINVSAVEGQFARANDAPFHPHTNMAKAALNMLTRTTAKALAATGIYVNSVDTGWMSDERPFAQAEAARDQHGFYPPLDPIDAAARIYAPIVQGLTDTAEPVWGQFLKDYQPHPW
jgi:NAD(P)-dependent dehydrogenase (short-subunit alcohol dehydrogenase family)